MDRFNIDYSEQRIRELTFGSSLEANAAITVTNHSVVSGYICFRFDQFVETDCERVLRLSRIHCDSL